MPWSLFIAINLLRVLSSRNKVLSLGPWFYPLSIREKSGTFTYVSSETARKRDPRFSTMAGVESLRASLVARHHGDDTMKI